MTVHIEQKAKVLCIAAAALLLSACTGTAPTDDQAVGPHPLPALSDSKEDNYISTNAREFEFKGSAHATLPEGFDALEAEAQTSAIDRAVQSRLSTIASSVRSHINGVIREANGGITGEDASFFAYFKRNNQESEGREVLGDGRVRFDFSMECVGSVYLMSKVAPEATSRRVFEIEVKGYNDPKAEKVEVEISGSESRDAFPKYKDLFDDGVFDIGLHFGGDYNEGRHDIETAKWTVEYLIEGGWKNDEVKTFEDLRIDSPPFTNALLVEGREIEAQVYVYHSDLDGGAEQVVLTDAMKLSLAQRDVVIYSGHAGEGAGLILDYHPRYQIAASEFATIPMAEKYQIFVFDGCQTYRSYVDDILKNPAKSFDNLDAVTTVNTTPFGAGYQVIHEFIYWLTLTSADGNHFPLTWKQILRGINTRNFKSVHYGVHGIDNDPTLNPHASEDITCRPCENDNECGAGGNFCLGYSGGSACGVACASDAACGEGFRCARITQDPELWYYPKQCVRRDYTCR